MPQAAHLSSSAGDAINSTKEKEAWDLSPENPYNWKQSARWTNALIISFTGFLSTVCCLCCGSPTYDVERSVSRLDHLHSFRQMLNWQLSLERPIQRSSCCRRRSTCLLWALVRSSLVRSVNYMESELLAYSLSLHSCLSTGKSATQSA